MLHALRLKGFADNETVTAHAGLPTEQAVAHLENLAKAGLASHREGRVSGWSLTQEGRAHHQEVLAAELDAADARQAVHEGYRAFLAVNRDLLAACTDWQMREVDGQAVVNDHSDPAYDAAVVARLRDVHARIEPVCLQLAATLDRFASYRPRLTAALRRVEAGEAEWFTRPLIDSYHTVWFELHEDLLSTLGIERSKEEVFH